MKKLALFILLFLPITLFAPSNPKEITIEQMKPINPHIPLMEAMSVVESNQNAFAVNIEEQAYGLLQIRQCKLDDYNKAVGKNYNLTDLFNTELSKIIFYWHCGQYSPYDFETIARVWNGSGEMTKVYWEKVKRELNK
jgi:hypothetical protein